MSRSPLFATLALAAVACEVAPCPKDRVLRADQLPCDCQGTIVSEASCGNLTCTADGIWATTLADTGCTSSSTTTR